MAPHTREGWEGASATQPRLLVPLTPNVFRNVAFFYPIGNTPPRFLTQELPREWTRHDVLLLGVGDCRNMLYTVRCERALTVAGTKHTRLDFTMCDLEAAILARNIILFQMLLDASEYVTDPTTFSAKLYEAWHVYYSQYLSQPMAEQLQSIALKLLADGSTLEDWHSMPIGQYVRMVSSSTHRRILALLQKYSDPDRLPAKRSYAAARKSAYKTYERETETLPQFVHGSAGAPFMEAMKDFERTSSVVAKYIESGVAWPEKAAKNIISASVGNLADFTVPNAMFVFTEANGDVTSVHYGTDVIEAFHLGEMYTHAGAKLKHPMDLCFEQFCTWAESYIRSAFFDRNVVVRVCVADALSFCQVLGAHGNGQVGQSKQGVKSEEGKLGGFMQIGTFEPVTLDGGDYEERVEEVMRAPVRFSHIDTSNLSDSLGLVNILFLCSGLLTPHPFSTLQTDILANQSIYPNGKLSTFLTTLCGVDPVSVPVMTGLAPRDLLSMHSLRSKMFAAVSALPQLKENLTGSRTPVNITWAHVWSLESAHPPARSQRVKFDAAATAQVLKSLARALFQSLSEVESTLLMGAKGLSSQSLSLYHGGSFAAIVQRAQRNVVFDRAGLEQFADDWRDGRVWNMSKMPSSLELNYVQEVYLWLHLAGLITKAGTFDQPAHTTASGVVGPLTIMQILDKNPRFRFLAGPDAPSLVRLVIAIPWDTIEFAIGDPKTIPTPPLEIGVGTTNDYGFDNIFSAGHMAIARKIMRLGDSDGDRWRLRCLDFTLEECTPQDTGSMLVLSAVVPGSIFLLEPPDQLHVRVCVAAMGLNRANAVNKLGPMAQVWGALVSDTKHVTFASGLPYLGKPPTNQSKEALLGVRPTNVIPSPRADDVKPMKTDSVSQLLQNHVGVAVDGNGSVLSFQCQIDVKGESARALLADKEGGKVDAKQVSSFVVRVHLLTSSPQRAAGECTADIVFPFPVDGNTLKTQFSRTRFFVNVIVAPRRTGYPPNPFPVFALKIPGSTPQTTMANWGESRIPLSALPEIDWKYGGPLVFPLVSSMLTAEERQQRNIKIPEPIVSLKDSLHTIMCRFLAQGAPAGSSPEMDQPTDWFYVAFNEPASGKADGRLIIYVDEIRLDHSTDSVVADVCVCVLTERNNGDIVPFIAPRLGKVSRRGRQIVTVTADGPELDLWWKFLPACVERARTRNHKPTCEYLREGVQIPLCEKFEEAREPYCSCFQGVNMPSEFQKECGKLVSGYFCRAAISPILPGLQHASFAEKRQADKPATTSSQSSQSFQTTNTENSNSGGKPQTQQSATKPKAENSASGKAKGQGGLEQQHVCGVCGKREAKLCGRCKRVAYCGAACQRTDWPAHKVGCKAP